MQEGIGARCSGAGVRSPIAHHLNPTDPSPTFSLAIRILQHGAPPSVEFPGALYHVTSRGNERRPIFLGNADTDRGTFLDTLAQTLERFNWICHAYCLMTNHHHTVAEIPDGNLSKGMRQLNGVYTQRVNRTHGRVGHLFQGRFKGILVEKESHLLELARYVVMNPVRAGMVATPEDWRWGSYRATAGLKAPAQQSVVDP